MNSDNRLSHALFLMRLGVFIVMFIWTLDKFIRPEHAAAVYGNFYHIGLSSTFSYIIGIIEVIILIGFLLGYKKRLTYGTVLILHAVSTLSSYKQYLSPFSGPNILFFAAWPMLAACFALYYLRDRDTMLVVEKE